MSFEELDEHIQYKSDKPGRALHQIELGVFLTRGYDWFQLDKVMK